MTEEASVASEDSLISRSPTRGNPESTKSTKLHRERLFDNLIPDVSASAIAPQVVVLEEVDFISSGNRRMRRSVSHDQFHDVALSMNQNALETKASTLTPSDLKHSSNPLDVHTVVSSTNPSTTHSKLPLFQSTSQLISQTTITSLPEITTQTSPFTSSLSLPESTSSNSYTPSSPLSGHPSINSPNISRANDPFLSIPKEELFQNRQEDKFNGMERFLPHENSKSNGKKSPTSSGKETLEHKPDHSRTFNRPIMDFDGGFIDIAEYSNDNGVEDSLESLEVAEENYLQNYEKPTTEPDYVYGDAPSNNSEMLLSLSDPQESKENDTLNFIKIDQITNYADDHMDSNRLEEENPLPLYEDADDLPQIETETNKNIDRKTSGFLINLNDGKVVERRDITVKSAEKVDIDSSDLSALHETKMMGDDPHSYFYSNSNKNPPQTGSRDLWSLGWIYTNNVPVHKVERKVTTTKPLRKKIISTKDVDGPLEISKVNTERKNILQVGEINKKNQVMATSSRQNIKNGANETVTTSSSVNDTTKTLQTREMNEDELVHSSTERQLDTSEEMRDQMQSDDPSISVSSKGRKGGKTIYTPFSTWSKKDKSEKPRKGGKETISSTKKTGSKKGGKITEVNVNPRGREFYKRSTRSRFYPNWGHYHPAYDQRYGNSYPHSPSSGRNPDSNGAKIRRSKVLQKLRSDSTTTDVNRETQDPDSKTAYDLFPHIFDYDLKEHDDYYYDEQKYWFDEFWTKDEDLDDSLNFEEISKPKVKVMMREAQRQNTAAKLQPQSQFPDGLKVMALTRENFHVEAPEIPETVPLNSKDAYNYDDHNIEIVTLREESPPLAPRSHKDGTHYKNYENKILHNTENDVYIHPSSITEDAHSLRPSGNTDTVLPLESARRETHRRSGQEYIIEEPEDTTTAEPGPGERYDTPLSQQSFHSENTHPRESGNVQQPVGVPSYSVPKNRPNYKGKQNHQSTESHTLDQNEPTRASHKKNGSEAVIQNVIVQHNTIGLIPLNRSQHLVPGNHSRHPKRVTVNVTIGTQDETEESSKIGSDIPFYVLSVSVPTSGEGEKPQINIMNPHHPTTSEQEEIGEIISGTKINLSKAPHQRLGQSRLNPSSERFAWKQEKADCRCPCPCASDSKMPTADKSAISPPGCSSSQDNASSSILSILTTPQPKITTTIPPPPPNIYYELREHRQRPEKTIPPDGTTFKMMKLGHKQKHRIEPYSYWNMQFYQPESAYVKFEIAVPRGASLGIYGRRNALPTHTSYDFLQVLSGYKIGTSRNTRSSLAPTQVETLVKYLDQGQWFLSVYNDDGDPQDLSLGADVSSEFTEGCPKGCSGNGDCILGSCQCYPGFIGSDCTQMKCPVLCSGNGEYREGQCVCRPGWKGQECSVRHDECEVPDCSGHGHCVDGKCLCAKGFKGENCEAVDCPHPTCSKHGWCVNGTCICQKGWRGPDCSRMDDAALQCLPDCSGHGHFDLVGQQCVCEPEWTGSECNKRVCGLDCGYHGRCEGDKCLCDDGWTGDRCDHMTCDARCEDHGQCKNGTCICMTGWNGRHCTLSGCPRMCSSHGSCIMVEEEWVCSCQDDWEGPDCNVMLESNCDDRIDNDDDGLTDCADAECCSSSSCTHSTQCKSSADPIDILLRKQPPAVTASFFQRMRFIVEESSVQAFADVNAFNRSRASVVRGRIISGRGSGLVGVRVSHFRPKDTGFTLSRHGGWFDLMVNGGGAVKLHFGKSQFLPLAKTVWVPWNEIVVIDTIVLTTAELVPPPPPTPCPDHNYISLKPVVLATWKHGFQGGCSECSAILTESQVLQESLPIPGTGLYLVYHSSRALGYESTIQLQLTPSLIPQTLRRIYLKITIEGILFEKTFEADTDIKFTYAWNRLNVYRQRVYGVTWAIVRVGYAYSNCDQIIWDTQSTQVSGHDMSVSDIGGWDLSIHHRYNFHEGILQKGDGSNMYLKQRPRILKTLMGDGHQRDVNCRRCEGPAEKQRLLTPAALAPAPDGSLYVADFNLIRRIYPDKSVRTVVRLNETRVSYRYHLAVSPVDGSVYISDPEAHQILKVKDPDDVSRPEENFMPFVGSGERCLPGDEIGCGDGGLARDAKLQYPKGMAISSKEVLYFADGTNVRAVDVDGIISTAIGTHRHRSHWQPLQCSGTMSVVDVSLRWPTSLAVSPLDESLYVLDDHHVLRLSTDGRVKVIAGRPLHCPPLSKNGPTDLAAQTTLRSPQSLAFTPNGDLYIAESDTERINRIRVINTDERIHDFAGAESKCNCRDELCPCFDESHVLAATTVFSTISAIAVTPDGAVHVLDQGNLRIRSVIASIPQPTNSRDYEIYSPETQEIYIFNRFGHHIETRNIPTQRTVYIFIYNVNTSNGKLSSVTDAAGNKINFLRDYAGQVTVIENSRQQKSRMKMSRMRRLEEMVTPDEHNVTLTYHGASGLLRSRMDSTGRAHVYTYDKYGRLTRTATPSGQVIDLAFDLSEQGARILVTRDASSPVTMLIKGTVVTETIGLASSVTAQLPDGSIILKNPWGHHIATETVAYTLLRDNILANSFPVHGRQRTEINQELVNSFDWKYFMEAVEGDPSIVKQMGRKLSVNGEEILSFKYDLFSGTEAVINKGGITLLNVTYDDLGRPLRWTPAEPFQAVSLKYDRYGLLQEWQWGEQREDYLYDRAGRFEGIAYADGSKITYSYKDISSIKPYKVSVYGGAEHLLEYDDGGALSAITTPRGHKYHFQIQPSVLHNRFTFTPPGSPHHPYQILYSDSGRLLAKVLPQQAGRAIYNYDEAGRLQHQIFGDGSVEYGYHPETGLIRSVTLRELAYEQRIDNNYHAGLVKEQRVRFGPAVPLNAAKMRFLYDGNARPRRVEIEINGNELSDYEMKYNMIQGTLENIDDLKITRSQNNKTIIQDASKTMLRVSIYDSHGRIKEESLSIHGRLVHRLRYIYDLRGRLASKTTWRGPGSLEFQSNYSYTPDGFLQSVEGAESWQFRYDSNGNMISVVEGGREITAIYDMSDRLVDWGEEQINMYDAAGRVIQQKDVHISYTSRGNIRHSWRADQFRVTYRHDHKGRLTSWEDHQGNVTQFFYADLRRPFLPTHIHYPSKELTHTMFYDDRGHLIAMQTENGRLWVITDIVGTPLSVFDSSGVLVKEIIRSPWGETLRDSRPDIKLHLDFFGSIRDPITGFLIFQMHPYDPKHGQWMAPRYDRIPNTLEHVTSIYMHRFFDNNPVNPVDENDNHYTDTYDWLSLFGMNMDKMLGSKYHDETLDNPLEDIQNKNIKPSLRVISGLSCSKKGALQSFSRPSLLPESLVQIDEPRLATSRWSMLGKFSSSGPVLGPGILVSRVNDRALVTLVPYRENSVVQAVARDVLNGSALLDVTLPHHKHHTLYLVKEDISAMSEDLEQLQRLSGIFNVTNHEAEHPEIRVIGTTASLVFMYGTNPEAARHRILRHVHHRAAEHAWQAERRLVESGGPSLHPWTAEEREILLRDGQVPGFVAAELHSVRRFPLLADDASNVVFRRDIDRRRKRFRPFPPSLS